MTVRITARFIPYCADSTIASEGADFDIAALNLIRTIKDMFGSGEGGVTTTQVFSAMGRLAELAGEHEYDQPVFWKDVEMDGEGVILMYHPDSALLAQFVEDIITTALETSTWAKPITVPWRKPVEVEEIEPSDGYEPVHGILDANTICEAIRQILYGSIDVPENILDILADSWKESDASNIDANIADVIVQVAVLDEIVYG